jgi:hypothetical protein
LFCLIIILSVLNFPKASPAANERGLQGQACGFYKLPNLLVKSIAAGRARRPGAAIANLLLKLTQVERICLLPLLILKLSAESFAKQSNAKFTLLPASQRVAVRGPIHTGSGRGNGCDCADNFLNNL